MSLKSILSSIICVGGLFAIIYPLKFVFFPFATTRMLFGIAGIFLLLSKENMKKLEQKSSNIISIFALIMVVSLVTFVINASSDFFFFKYPLSILIIFSSCCFWHALFRKLIGTTSHIKISQYIVTVIDIQILIVILFFLLPSVKDLMLSFLTEEMHPLSEQGGDLSFRVSGFGSGYYESGIVNSVGLLICMFRLCDKSSGERKLFYLISFLLITIIGALMSRSTLIGFLIAIMYYFYTLARSPLMFVLSILKLAVVLCAAFVLLQNIEISDEVDQQIHFGFEMFYNYFDSGEMTTLSSSDTLSSYMFPTNLKTWIIGDGYYFSENGEDNYMIQDIGYIRLLFYFGIIGMLCMFVFNYYMFKCTAKSLNCKTLPFLFLVLYFFLNVKGEVLQLATFYGLYLFLPCELSKKHKEKNTQINELGEEVM